MRKRILFISNLFPNHISPNMAAFNRQQISVLQEFYEIEVISPISWLSLLKDNLRHLSRVEDGISIYHPTYYYTPRILREWYGEFYWYSIKQIASQLLKNKKFDLIYSSWLYPDSWAAAKLAKQFNLPLFVKVHGSDVNRLSHGTTLTRKSLLVVKQAEKVICVSRALKERLIGLGVPDDKLTVIYNGVDRSTFYPVSRAVARSLLQLSSEDIILLYVGNLKKDKGLAELVGAFKLIASEPGTVNWHLIIVGSGSFGEEIIKIAGPLFLNNRVRMTGSLSLKQIANWMNAANVLCLPSYMEGVPNVVLEALACGTNIVATDVGGIPELDTGVGCMTLIPAKTIEPLVEALKNCVLKDMSVAPSAFPYSWSENADQLRQIFSCR